MGGSDKQPGSEELTGLLPAIPKYIESDMQAIIDDWNAAVEDDITGVLLAHEDVHIQPVYKPLDVAMEAHTGRTITTTRARWERYTTERKLFIIEDMDKMNICLTGPHQKEYVCPICWTNVNAFYHPDPNSLPVIPNTNMKILTDMEQPTVRKRQQQFTSLERTSLEVK